MRKTLTLLLCCVFVSYCFLGVIGLCSRIFNREYPYRGQYKELYTVAVYSIPDTSGYMYHGEGAYNSDIYVWEQDDYGRTLFAYCEDYSNQVFSLVISQSYDETNVYFYPDTNYSLTFIDTEYCYEGIEDGHLKNRTENFYLENKEKLKEENDWNKPLDKTKCVSYPITDHKSLGENIYSLSSVECDKILNEYSETLNLPNPEMGPHRYNSILQVDADGKILHEIIGVHRNFDNPEWSITDEYTYYDITLWVITDKDGNYDKESGVFVIRSEANNPDGSIIYDPEDILRFKNENNWTYSYCNEQRIIKQRNPDWP